MLFLCVHHSVCFRPCACVLFYPYLLFGLISTATVMRLAFFQLPGGFTNAAIKTCVMPALSCARAPGLVPILFSLSVGSTS